MHRMTVNLSAPGLLSRARAQLARPFLPALSAPTPYLLRTFAGRCGVRKPMTRQPVSGLLRTSAPAPRARVRARTRTHAHTRIQVRKVRR